MVERNPLHARARRELEPEQSSDILRADLTLSARPPGLAVGRQPFGDAERDVGLEVEEARIEGELVDRLMNELERIVLLADGVLAIGSGPSEVEDDQPVLIEVEVAPSASSMKPPSNIA